MATPFLWTSRTTVVREGFKKTSITPSVKTALDSVFNGTLNPKRHRREWYLYLKSLPDYLRIDGEIGITKEEDLSMALPPIEDVDLPLLEKIREGLSEYNANAASYPYSTRCASDIKRLIHLYASVKSKVNVQKLDVSALVSEIAKRERTKVNIKHQLLTQSLGNASKKNWLAQLSTQLGAIRRLNSKLDGVKKEYSKGYRYQLMLRNKLEEVFFKKPSWKYKTDPSKLPPQTTPAGDAPRTDEIFSNEELFSSTSGISNRTIYSVIEEEMQDLKPSNPDIHPFAWKNLLILPAGIQGLPNNWNKNSNRIGQAKNELKLQHNGASAALIATWEQFATFGTEGFANPLQKALASPSTHGVELSAHVDIMFNQYGQIVPCIPWWDNEIRADRGQNQIGEHSDHNQKITSTKGVEFISQVGFAWQYKIPAHSRANMENTPWELAVDEQGNPFKEFNLPKGTNLYAVRLAFIKADGSVVPLSNIITGSDVFMHMKLKVDFANGVYNKWDSAKGNYGISHQISKADIKRLTKKARALLNITGEVEKIKIENELKIQRTEHDSINNSVNTIESKIANCNAIKSFLENQQTQDARTLVHASTPIPDIKSKNKRDLKIDDNIVELSEIEKYFDPSTPPTASGYDPSDASERYVQAALFNKYVMEPTVKSLFKTRDSIIDKLNIVAEKIENLEKEQMSWYAGDYMEGSYVNNFSTEHAPGLIGKDKAVTQVISFLTTCWPEKYIKESALGLPKAGYWLPFEQDLPAEACIAMEPWLKETVVTKKLDMLNSGQLRASNYDSNIPIADVSNVTSEGYDAWLNDQKSISNDFQLAVVQRKLQTITQLSTKITAPNTAVRDIFEQSRQRQIRENIARRQKEQKRIAERQRKIFEERKRRAEEEKKKRLALEYKKREAEKEAKVEAILQQMLDYNAKISLQEEKQKNIKNTIENISKEINKQVQTNVSNLNPAEFQTHNNLLKTLKTNLDTAKDELDKSQKEVEKLNDELSKTRQQYNREVALAITRKDDEIERQIKKAIEDIDDLEDENRRLLGQIDLEERKARKALERKIKIMEQQAQARKNTLADIIRKGNIDIQAQNSTTTKPEDYIAPADLRFGGGYFWSVSNDLENVPYGSYLVYDEKIDSGDRFKLAWSSVNPEHLEHGDERGSEEVVLHDVATNAKITTKHRDVQPVLSDDVQVLNTIPTNSLFELKRVTTDSNGKDLVYIGKPMKYGAVDILDNGGFTLQFYDVLMKPGTYVEFILKKQVQNDLGLSDEEKNRNRLVNLTNFISAQDSLGDDYIDLTNGVVLSGTIESIRIANAETLVEPARIMQATADYKKSQQDFSAENTKGIGTDTVKLKTLRKIMIQNKEQLKELEKENGRFDFKEYETSKTMRPIVVADVKIIPGVIIKNVPYSDIAEISLCSKQNSTSDVIGHFNNKIIKGTVSYYSKRNDDTFDVNINNRNIERIKKEDLRPIYRDGTDVAYPGTDGKMYLGTVKSFNANKKYTVEDSDSGNTVDIEFDNLSIYKDSTSLGDINLYNGASIYKDGMKLASYVPLFHKFNNGNDLYQFVEDYYDRENKTNLRRMTGLNPVINDKSNSGFRKNSVHKILMRAEIKLKNNKFYNLDGNITDQATMESLLTLMNSNKPLVDKTKVLEMDNTMVDLVCVSHNVVHDANGDDVEYALSVKFGENGDYVNIDFSDIDYIKVPQIFEQQTNGKITKKSTSTISNLKSVKPDLKILEADLKPKLETFEPSLKAPEKLETIVEMVDVKQNKQEENEQEVLEVKEDEPEQVEEVLEVKEDEPEEQNYDIEVSHLQTSKPKMNFEISSGGEEMEHDSEEEVVDEIESYPTSWSKPHLDAIAKWAAASSSDEKELNVSETEDAWEGESDMGGFASDVSESKESNMGGFASETSESKESTMGGFVSDTSENKSSNMGGFVSDVSENKELGGFASETSESKSSNMGGFVSDASENREFGGYASETSESKESNMGGFASETSDSKSSNMGGFVSDASENRELGGFASETSESKESNMGGFASETSDSKSSNMGGFVSETMSDTDQDDLTAIISKIDRQQEALWAEDSDTDTM